MNTKPRVLQIIPAYYPALRYGGAVKDVYDLSRSLVKLGIDVTVFTTNADGDENLDVPIGCEMEIEGVRVCYFTIGRPRSYFHSTELSTALKQRVKEFDLVHIHGLYVYPTLVASSVCRKQGIPYLISPKGMLDPFAIAMKSTLKKRLYLSLFEKKNIEQAAALHFTSTEEQRLAKTLGLKVDHGFVVPHALDLADFPNEIDIGASPNGENDGYRAQTVLFLSRISPKKGLDLLIPAFSNVVAARPESRLEIVGPDDDGYLPTVKILVAQYRLQNNVIYRGMLLGEEKLKAFREATVFVLPSYSENFGLVVIEAMACAKPVVITERVNIYREVIEADCGLVTPCEPNAIAEALLSLLSDPKKAREFGKRGREVVERKFTLKRYAADILNAYQQILTLI